MPMCQQEGFLNKHYNKWGGRNEAGPPQQCQWGSDDDDDGVFGSGRGKKTTIVSVPNQLQGRAGGQSSGVRSSPWLSLSSCGDVGNTSELIHKLSPLQTRLARGLQ